MLDDIDGSFVKNPKGYIDFIEEYGTHFFKDVTWGAARLFQWNLGTIQLDNQTIADISSMAFGQVQHTLGIPVTFYGGVGNFDFKVFSYGWYEKPNGLWDFVQKAQLIPDIMSGHLKPITTLIRNDTLREQMELAIKVRFKNYWNKLFHKENIKFRHPQ